MRSKQPARAIKPEGERCRRILGGGRGALVSDLVGCWLGGEGAVGVLVGRNMMGFAGDSGRRVMDCTADEVFCTASASHETIDLWR